MRAPVISQEKGIFLSFVRDVFREPWQQHTSAYPQFKGETRLQEIWKDLLLYLPCSLKQRERDVVPRPNQTRKPIQKFKFECEKTKLELSSLGVSMTTPLSPQLPTISTITVSSFNLIWVMGNRDKLSSFVLLVLPGTREDRPSHAVTAVPCSLLSGLKIRIINCSGNHTAQSMEKKYTNNSSQYTRTVKIHRI